ncbi:MAG: polymerase, sigma-24 subunit, subfamily [Ferruginibacter sp.]|nr:polymerase, sigma-24 subunit, subfamily [Ferruginibacter sp.]
MLASRICNNVHNRVSFKLNMDIAQLIREAKQGSAPAQKCLFDLLSDKMLLVCRRYVKGNEDAEEVLLDGFYKFFKTLGSFQYQGDAALYNWVKKIMINECLMLLRKKNVFTIVTEADAADCPLEAEALNNLSAKEIFDLIVQLPVGYRTVFNLYEIEGLEHKEIAAMLGITEGTSKSQLSKAKILLQKNLAQNGTRYVKRKSR